MTCLPHRMGGLQWLALAAGLICTSITAANLAGDAIVAGHLELEHVNTLGLLAVTIAAGLLAKATTASRRWGYALAFYVAFVCGTALVIYGSVGRQHGTAALAVAEVEAANGALAALKADMKRVDDRIVDLRADLGRFTGVRSAAEVKAALDAVVGSGPGKVAVAIWRRTSGCAATEITKPESAAACEPVSALRIENGKALEREALRRRMDAAEGERASLTAKIAAAGGERPVPVKAKGFAEAAGVLGFDAKRIEYVMSRLDKVALAIVLELGAVLGLEFAFAGLLHPTPVDPTPSKRRVEEPEIEPEKPSAEIIELRQPRRTAMTREAARQDLMTLLAGGGEIPMQQVLTKRWGVPAGTVSRWLKAFATEDLIKRRSHGREKSVRSA